MRGFWILVQTFAHSDFKVYVSKFYPSQENFCNIAYKKVKKLCEMAGVPHIWHDKIRRPKSNVTTKNNTKKPFSYIKNHIILKWILSLQNGFWSTCLNTNINFKSTIFFHLQWNAYVRAAKILHLTVYVACSSRALKLMLNVSGIKVTKFGDGWVT